MKGPHHSFGFPERDFIVITTVSLSFLLQRSGAKMTAIRKPEAKCGKAAGN
jgi:hypothetical protein